MQFCPPQDRCTFYTGTHTRGTHSFLLSTYLPTSHPLPQVLQVCLQQIQGSSCLILSCAGTTEIVQGASLPQLWPPNKQSSNQCVCGGLMKRGEDVTEGNQCAGGLRLSKGPLSPAVVTTSNHQINVCAHMRVGRTKGAKGI
jgi:hypothetical protein